VLSHHIILYQYTSQARCIVSFVSSFFEQMFGDKSISFFLIASWTNYMLKFCHFAFKVRKEGGYFRYWKMILFLINSKQKFTCPAKSAHFGCNRSVICARAFFPFFFFSSQHEQRSFRVNQGFNEFYITLRFLLTRSSRLATRDGNTIE